MTPLSLAKSIILPNTSATKINKNGDKGSPCLRPLDAWKKSPALPFTIIAILQDDKHPQIHFLHLTPNPFLSKTKPTKPQSTWSYAFSKSTLNTIPSLRTPLYSSTTSLATKTISKICRPCTSAPCAEEIVPPRTTLSLLESTLAKIL
ncbi:hypothetical protein CsSME_00032733 [Camellia sinensis var. sinensis]